MGRKCDCSALLDAARNDLRLRAVPAAARWLWLMLADQLLRFPETRISSAAEIALMISLAETDAETHLETLLQTGLLLRRGNGTLGVALAEAPSLRRGIGGRPRKGETEAAYQDRQRSMRLLGVHQGGAAAAETRETPVETPSRARACLAASAEEEASKQDAPGFAELGGELAEMARLDPARGTYDFAVVKDWLARGATAELLREVVGRVADRWNYRAPERAGLRYFAPMVAEALAARPASLSAADRALRAHNDALAAWINAGQIGPRPVRSDAA